MIQSRDCSLPWFREQTADRGEEEKGLIGELYKTSEIKVGALGFKIDLKPIVKRLALSPLAAKRETLPRPSDDAGRCRRGSGLADRVVQSLPAPGRAGPGGDGCPITAPVPPFSIGASGWYVRSAVAAKSISW